MLTVPTMPSNDENNNYPLDVGIRRSLFGSTSPTDIGILLDEQQKLDRDRFLENYGIDIDVEILKTEFERPYESRRIFPRLKITNHSKFMQRRAFQQHNRQLKITDFCAVKKSCRTGESKTS